MKRDIGVAYILWLLLGFFGGHRFYARQKGTAIIMMILTVTVIGWPITLIWWLIDALLLPDLVDKFNREVDAQNLQNAVGNHLRRESAAQPISRPEETT